MTLVGATIVRAGSSQGLRSVNATSGREASRLQARHGVTLVATATATSTMARRATDAMNIRGRQRTSGSHASATATGAVNARACQRSPPTPRATSPTMAKFAQTISTTAAVRRPAVRGRGSAGTSGRRTRLANRGAITAAIATSGAAGAAVKTCVASGTTRAGDAHSRSERTSPGGPRTVATAGARTIAYHHVRLTPATRIEPALAGRTVSRAPTIRRAGKSTTATRRLAIGSRREYSSGAGELWSFLGVLYAMRASTR